MKASELAALLYALPPETEVTVSDDQGFTFAVTDFAYHPADSSCTLGFDAYDYGEEEDDDTEIDEEVFEQGPSICSMPDSTPIGRVVRDL